jgi:ribosomal-protein-alanine N-acetyltransferase
MDTEFFYLPRQRPPDSLFTKVISLDEEFFIPAWSEQSWRGVICESSLPHLLGLICADDVVAGFSLLQLGFEERLAHLLKIIIHPNYRHRGYGRQLLDNTQAQLREAGRLERIYLEVASDNTDALQLYRAAGFRKLNVVRNFYSKGLDAVTMHCYL